MQSTQSRWIRKDEEVKLFSMDIAWILRSFLFFIIECWKLFFSRHSTHSKSESKSIFDIPSGSLFLTSEISTFLWMHFFLIKTGIWCPVEPLNFHQIIVRLNEKVSSKQMEILWLKRNNLIWQDTIKFSGNICPSVNAESKLGLER